MSDTVREITKKGLKQAIGKIPDYQIIFNALDYYNQGLIVEADLSEIDNLINLKNNPIEPPEAELTIEDSEEI